MSSKDQQKEIPLNEEIKEMLLKKDPAQGARVSGKEWKTQKKAFRVKSLGVKSSYHDRKLKREKENQTKAKLKELKDEKEAEKKERIQKIKEKREKKEEKERYERLAAVMHSKRLDRLKRREKRNKLLKDR